VQIQPEGVDSRVSLAAAVLDGQAVDWAACESSASTDADRAFLMHLRAIAAIPPFAARLAPPLHDSLLHPSKSPTRADDTPVHWGTLRVIEKVGRGSFGDVYRAWDTRLDREVALKLLRHRDEHEGDTVIEEGRLLARVRHPNVATVYGAERIDGRTGLWMEFVHGETLEEELQRRGPLPAREVVQIGVTLCDALAAVHAAGLLHRDVKAQNVMRARDGRLVLMDFGAGHDPAEAEGSTPLVGTPAYLAPEVLAGSPATVRSDVYGLGILLYHLATGSFPVRGPRAAESHETQARRDQRRKLSPPLSRRLAPVLQRATHPDATARYADAGALAEALRRCSAAARHRALAAASVGSVAVLLATGLVWSGNGGGGQSDAVLPGGAAAAVVALHENLRLNANIRTASDDPRLATCTPWGAGAVGVCDFLTGEITVLRQPSGEHERSPVAHLSPDTALVAYVWTEGNPPAAQTIRIIGSDGTGDRELFRPEHAATTALYQWTADAQAVLAGVHAGDESRLLLLPVSGDSPLVLGRVPRARLIDVALSRDSRVLMVTIRSDGGDADDAEVQLEELPTGTRETVIGSAWKPYNALWTPDGRGIVFASNRLGPHALFLQRLDGLRPAGEPTLLREFSRSRLVLRGFSRDGTLLLTLVVGQWDVFRAPVDAQRGTLGALQRIDPRTIEHSRSAQWSPDGQRLAYLTGSVGLRGWRIMIRDRSGREQSSLPMDGPFGNLGFLRWSPDSTRLAVAHVGPPGALALSAVSTQTGAAQLLATGSEIRDARWDGADHLYVVRDGAIDRLNVESRAGTTIYRPTAPWRVAKVAPSPVGGSLAVLEEGGSETPACAVRLVTGTTVRDRHTMPDAWCEALTWSGDGGRMLVATSQRIPVPRPRPSSLWFMDPFDSPPAALPLPGEPAVDLSMSSDGSELLLTMGHPRPEVFRLTGFVTGAASLSSASTGTRARR